MFLPIHLEIIILRFYFYCISLYIFQIATKEKYTANKIEYLIRRNGLKISRLALLVLVLFYLDSFVGSD